MNVWLIHISGELCRNHGKSDSAAFVVWLSLKRKFYPLNKAPDRDCKSDLILEIKQQNLVEIIFIFESCSKWYFTKSEIVRVLQCTIYVFPFPHIIIMETFFRPIRDIFRNKKLNYDFLSCLHPSFGRKKWAGPGMSCTASLFQINSTKKIAHELLVAAAFLLLY